MNAKRLLAVLVAAAMITGAWFVRNRVIDKPATTAAVPTIAPGTPAPGSSNIVCIPELEDACRASGLIYTVQPAGATLAALSSMPAPTVVWITLSPWPEMLDAGRAKAGQPPLPVDQRRALASTPVVISGPAERTKVLQAACPDLSWTCIGGKANKGWVDIGGQAGWQDVTFRHKDPLTSAGGLSVLGAALAGRVGRADLSNAELGASDIRSWASQLESANKQPASDPLTSVVVGARFDLVPTLSSEVPTSARVATIRPTPVALVGAVAMPTNGPLPAGTVDKLTVALGKNGWSPTVPPSGVPDAIGMQAVQQLWRDVTR